MLPGICDIIGAGIVGAGGSLTATISHDTISKTVGGTSGAPRTVTTATVTVTPSGGAGGYTYAWSRIEGDASITASAPTANATTFSATLDPDAYVTARFECVVTDVSGATVAKQVDVELQYNFIDT